MKRIYSAVMGSISKPGLFLLLTVCFQNASFAQIQTGASSAERTIARREEIRLPAKGQRATTEPRVLTGWGGGQAEDVVPKAAEIGFAELVVHHEDAKNFARFIDLGKQRGIGIYAWLFLGDIPAWKKAYPDSEPPLQVMNAAEEEALKRIQADKTPGKSRYQFGGEPVNEMEAFETPLLCFHDPRVIEAFKKQIDEMLSFPGVKGVAFDYIGYRNYRCCLCKTSQMQFAVYQEQHPELSRELALNRFSLETLVAFNNRLSAYVRTVKPRRTGYHTYLSCLPS